MFRTGRKMLAMVKRRRLVQSAFAASALSIIKNPVPSASTHASTGTPSSIAIYKVIYDERFPESVGFANEIKKSGIPVHGIKGDMTDVWYNDFYNQWQKSPAAIAGLTAHGALFCLERLAWDKGMRVVLRAEHRVMGEGSMQHAFTGPARLLEHFKAMPQGNNWQEHMATMIASCPAKTTKQCSQTVISENCETNYATDDPLYSWLIAPAQRPA